MSLNPPQNFRKTAGEHRRGLAANRPAAANVLVGTIYFSTDTFNMERSNGTIWESYPGLVALTDESNTFTDDQVITADLGVTGLTVLADANITDLTITGSVDCQVFLDLTSGQIKFPATQAASGNANTLDDYEEGSWTPVDSSGAGLVFPFAVGTYTKIGNRVFVSGQVIYPATASGAAAIIGGLPFTVQAVNTAFTVGYTAGAAVAYTLYAPGSASVIYPAIIGTGVQPTNAQMTGSNTIFAGVYAV